MPYNEKVDVYSFALVLYQILTLEKPFLWYSKNSHHTRVAKGGERPAMDPQIPKELQDLLKKAWSANIDERPSMTEVISILKSVISELSEPRRRHLVRLGSSSKPIMGKIQDQPEQSQQPRRLSRRNSRQGLGGVKIQPQ